MKFVEKCRAVSSSINKKLKYCNSRTFQLLYESADREMAFPFEFGAFSWIPSLLPLDSLLMPQSIVQTDYTIISGLYKGTNIPHLKLKSRKSTSTIRKVNKH